ncbi:NAD(P)-binding domain-containing protein [Halalkalibacter kiskunsagensis]|uniref:NAD(P)-binding domain-containing protein n=1 Tax=Halalkalibacter kiskunsagensis TaxID=1548599 RepID=A0ABV6KGQ6_9BACI
MKIGFIGLGNMGLPMSYNLIKAGYDVYGLNRSKSAEKELLQYGGKIGYSLIELAKEMDVILTCLPMPADVKEVYLDEDGLLQNGHKGLILADCSTVNPALNREIFDEARARNIEFFDAPVSGGTAGAQTGTLSIMVGGNVKTFETVKPVLESMGKYVDYVGESGSGSLVKLINQLMVGTHTQAVSEALALAEQNGLDLDQLVKILSASLSQSRVLERHYNDFISKNDYEPGFALQLLSKDLNLVAELAEESMVQLPIGSRVRNLVQRACCHELGSSDMSAMLKFQTKQDEQNRNDEPLKTFAVFLPMKDAVKSQTYRASHLQFLDDRRNEGVLYANGRFVDGAGGLVIYLARSEKEVEDWVRKDPYIIEGARDYEIHEWEMVPGM